MVNDNHQNKTNERILYDRIVPLADKVSEKLNRLDRQVGALEEKLRRMELADRPGTKPVRYDAADVLDAAVALLLIVGFAVLVGGYV